MNKKHIDPLEIYIDNNRDDFDQDQVPSMVWTDIERQLETTKLAHRDPAVGYNRPSLLRIMQVAAMFIVVMSVGLIIGMQINKDHEYQDPRLQEFAEAEKHYQQKINGMLVSAKAKGVNTATELTEEIKALDEVYIELKSELLGGTQSNTDDVVNAMIKNYRTKIEVLENVLSKSSKKPINIEDDKVEM